MQQHKILTWTLLILSIINFAPAAPVAVREGPEVRIDATVTRSVTATPQKRGSGESPLPNVNVPLPGPDSSHSTDILSQTPVAEQHIADNSRPPPDNPESSTGPRLPVKSMPVAFSLSPPPQRMRIMPVLNAVPLRALPPHPYSTHWSPKVPPNPGELSGSPVVLMPATGSHSLPPGRWSIVNIPGAAHGPPQDMPNPGKPSGSPVVLMPATGSHSLPPERWSILSIHGAAHGPPQDMYPTHWRVGSPPPRIPPQGSQSPGADPEALLAEFWDNLLKGKIKRRMYGSDAVTSDQEDPKMTNSG